MKNSLVLIPALFLFLHSAKAQETDDSLSVAPYFKSCEDGNIYQKLECTGQEAYRIMYSEMKYPDLAREKGVEGYVICNFIIDTVGHTTQITVDEGLGYGCDEEAIRLISILPEYVPATVDGKAVPFSSSLTIFFPQEKDKRYGRSQVDPYEDESFPPPAQILPPMPPPPPPPPPSENRHDIFMMVERMPIFGGCTEENYEDRRECGEKLLLQFFADSLVYEAGTDLWRNRVVIKFIVKKDGSISNAEIISSCGNPDIDQEVIRLALKMPNWEPGTQRGRPVAVQFTLPIYLDRY
ncbi:MAG: TonB family protein [Saprospiraceae bacterium]|nr:TonB family protein [Saprospiraceae bacterium]